MHDIAKFISGFQKFQKRYFCDENPLYEKLKSGQEPNALVVACIDSRVDPAMLMGCRPGELLVVRNVANLVPPYEPDKGRHGVSAALEFAVTRLEIQHLIVLGHGSCGGIHSLLTLRDEAQDSEFLGRWVRIAEKARQQTLEALADKCPELQQRACEQAAILVSLDNCLTFPWIRERVEDGRLFLHGWYFDLETGDLLSYLPASGAFEPLAPRCANPL